MVKKLSSVAELQSAFAKHCIGPQNEASRLAASSANRFAKLTSDAIATLNQHVSEFSEVYQVDLDNPGVLEFLMGLEAAGEGSLPFITIGKESFVATRNPNNRRYSPSRVGPIGKLGTYSNVRSRGLWGLSAMDPITYCWDGTIISGQHRYGMLMLIRAAGLPLGTIYIHLGLPPQWRDLADKARARKSTDDDTTDDTIISLEVVEAVQTKLSGEHDTLAVMKGLRDKSLIDLRKKLTGCISERMKGNDVSSTGDKLPQEERFDLVDRLGGEDEVTRFVTYVFESQRSQSGKYDRQFSELFSPAVIATALVLASNGEDATNERLASIVRDPSETPEEYAERKIAAKAAILQDEPLVIDWELVEGFLGALGATTADSGPFSMVFSDLFERIKNDKKSQAKKKYLWAKTSPASMSAMVALVTNYIGGDMTSSVWTTYREVKGEVSPYYRCFGGVDIGFVKQSKAKAKAE
jgi:hypothetical protein